MNEQQIIEHNTFIAKFMGLSHNIHYRNPLDKNNILDAEDLLFHSSWDWLMTVIEKIEREFLFFIGDQDESFLTKVYYNGYRDEDKKNRFETYCNSIFRDGIIKTYDDDKKVSAYMAVIEFIKWHNQDKK